MIVPEGGGEVRGRHAVSDRRCHNMRVEMKQRAIAEQKKCMTRTQPFGGNGYCAMLHGGFAFAFLWQNLMYSMQMA